MSVDPLERGDHTEQHPAVQGTAEDREYGIMDASTELASTQDGSRERRAVRTFDNMAMADTKLCRHEPALEMLERDVGPVQGTFERTHEPTAGVIDFANVVARHFTSADLIRPECLDPFQSKVGEPRSDMKGLYRICYSYRTGYANVSRSQLGQRSSETSSLILEVTEYLAQAYDSSAAQDTALDTASTYLLAHQHLREDLPETADKVHNLAVTLAEKYPDIAVKLFQYSLSMYERACVLDMSCVANTLKSMGIVLSHQNKFPEAIRALKQALEIEERALGLRHQDTVLTLMNLGVAYGRAGQHSTAIPVYKAALDVSESLFTPKQIQFGDIHYNIALSQLALGCLLDGLQHLYESFQIFREALGEHHIKSKKAKRLIDSYSVPFKTTKNKLRKRRGYRSRIRRPRS